MPTTTCATLSKWLQPVWQPSLARRLTLGMLLTLFTAWMAFYAFSSLRMLYWQDAGFDHELSAQVQALQRTIASTPEASLPAVLSGIATFVAEEDQGLIGFEMRTLSVWRADGTLVSGNSKPAFNSAGPAKADGFFNVTVKDTTYRGLGAWTPDCLYRIEVFQTSADRQRAFNRVMLSPSSLLPALVFFPLLLLPAWGAIRAGLRPVNRLAKELAERQPGDLRPVLLPHVYMELQPVIQEINAALARLRDLIQHERDFLANAAHELRTPLAVISAQTDVLLHSADMTPPNKEATYRLKGGVTRAARLVHQLLDLARLEAQVADGATSIDITNVAREMMAFVEPDARAKDMELSYVGPDSLTDHCALAALESVIGNLVGNAVRYGRQGGRVELRIDDLPDGHVRLSVLDDGPGIDPADRMHIFERFRRGKHAQASGSGLGLAIVSSAAKQLHARIEVGTGMCGQGTGVALTWHRSGRTASGDSPTSAWPPEASDPPPY